METDLATLMLTSQLTKLHMRLMHRMLFKEKVSLKLKTIRWCEHNEQF